MGRSNTCICKAESLCCTPKTQHSKSNILKLKKKIHRHVEQLAQKTNWKIQKDFQTYSERKIHREQGIMGK